MMKNTLTKLSLGVLMATGLSVSPVVMAEESPISANVALTSNYIYRGIPQGSEEYQGALQGGFDYAHESGFYAGTWGSSAGDNGAADATLELDYYVGFSKELENGVSYDIGYLYYDYPGVETIYNEVYASVGYKGFGFKYTTSPTKEDKNGYIVDYMSLSYETELSGLGVSATYGVQKDTVSYLQLDLSKSMAGLDFTLSVIADDYDDTNGPSVGTKDKPVYGVFTVGKSF
jgi:uncharacterized protein (TIGR02001 family)